MFLSEFTRDIASIAGGCWRRLVITDLIYKLLAFVVLTPLFSLLFRGLLWIAGKGVLSDIDIALFFAGPFGWLSAILLGAVWLSILAIEQASLLSILAAQRLGEKLGVGESLFFASRHLLVSLRVTARLILWTLVIFAPFLIIGLAVYHRLLGAYDINYYLAEKPAKFWIALAVGFSLSISFVGILLRCYSGWFLVLPLVLFDGVTPGSALRSSSERISGHRLRVVFWIVIWLTVVFALNAIVTTCIVWLGHQLISSSAGSLAILATYVGLVVILMVLMSLVVSVFATTLFAAMLFLGYQRSHPGEMDSLHRTGPHKLRAASVSGLMTRMRWSAVVVLSLLSATTVRFLAINSVKMEDRVQVMAHRGASHAAPENTLAAITSRD